MRIFDQSASSSSASSIGSDVVTPWPISERSTTTSTLSSVPIRNHAFGAKGAATAARPRPVAGRWKPMTRPAPATPAASRNSRRLMCAALMSRSLRGAMDGGADALVGAAATNIGHRRVDIGVRGMRILREQGRGGHDLPRLAVAALRHVLRDPRLLHGVRAVLGQAFDGGHALAGDGRHRQHAGARRDAVQVDGAGAALGDAAAELGAGEPERVTQHPQERRVGGDVDRFALAVDGEADRWHDGASSRKMEKTCTGGRTDGRGAPRVPMRPGTGLFILLGARASGPLGLSTRSKRLSRHLLTTSGTGSISSPVAGSWTCWCGGSPLPTLIQRAFVWHWSVGSFSRWSLVSFGRFHWARRKRQAPSRGRWWTPRRNSHSPTSKWRSQELRIASSAAATAALR